MAEGEIIRPKDLLAIWNALPLDRRHDAQIAIIIIEHYFGLPWIEKHVYPKSKTTGLFTIQGSINEQTIARMRVIDLAECLLNLRHVSGLGECISRMKAAENPEPSYAELHIGKMLFANDWSFRFVIPQSKRGEDYDLEINYFDQVVCADVKCKIEDAIPSANAISSALNRSRTQLPADKPGVFFMKIPHGWMEYPGWDHITRAGADDFLSQGSGRIVSIALYAEPIRVVGSLSIQSHAKNEITNPRHRFSKTLDWKFFDKRLGAMPPKYVRLFNFPQGLMGHEEDE